MSILTPLMKMNNPGGGRLAGLWKGKENVRRDSQPGLDTVSLKCLQDVWMEMSTRRWPGWLLRLFRF